MSDSKALLFPARQCVATLAHKGLVTFGHSQNVLVKVCRLRGFDDLPLLEITEELYVVDDRALQEDGLLGHECHRAVRIALGDRRRVLATDCGPTARRGA